MRDDVRRTGKRPREAYSEMVASVPKKFKDSASHAELVKVMPSFSEVQAQLSRHRQYQCTPVPDPLNIPDALKTTLRGRELLDDDPNFNEQFLLYSGQGGRLLVFCALTELQVLRHSQYIVYIVYIISATLVAYTLSLSTSSSLLLMRSKSRFQTQCLRVAPSTSGRLYYDAYSRKD